MLKSLFPDELKVNITIDDYRLNSNLTAKKQRILQKIFFVYNFRFYSIQFRTIKCY